MTFTEKQLEKFTRELFLTLTPDEVVEYWKQRNRWLRDQGKEHFIELMDGKTGKRIASI